MMLVAFCGIDGVGKSSIVEALKKSSLIEGGIYLKKNVFEARMLVRKFHVRDEDGYADINDGSFGRALAIADALDFLNYYERTIGPALVSPDVPLVVLDRYIPCYAAYLRAVAADIDPKQLFAQLRTADLTFYVTVDRTLLPARYRQRGGPEDDENPDLMARFEESYLDVINSFTRTLVRIDNSGPLTNTIERVSSELRKLISGIHRTECGRSRATEPGSND